MKNHLPVLLALLLLAGCGKSDSGEGQGGEAGPTDPTPSPAPTPEGPSPQVRTWIKALASDDATARAEAVQALGKAGAEAGVDPLIGVLGDADDNVAFFAAEALGRLGSAKAVGPLIAALGHGSLTVRSAAIKALRTITGEDHGQDRSAWSAWFASRGGGVRLVRTAEKTQVTYVDFSSWLPDSLRLSPDGSRAAYAAQYGNRFVVVVDGKEGKKYDQVVRGTPVFSRDSRHVAYGAGSSGAHVVVADGKEGEPYDEVFLVGYTPDGKKLFYGARVGNQVTFVVNGKEWGYYDGRGGVGHSPAGGHLACVFRKDKKWFVVRDEKESEPYDGVLNEPLQFSPDGKRLAYGAFREKKWFVVLDGVADRPYDGVGYITFSPDGKRLAYVAQTGGASSVVLDGEEMGRHKMAGLVTFSPDSKRLAYAARTEKGACVVVDGKPGKTYNNVNFLTFSPDGTRLAYAAMEGRALRLVVDGKEGKKVSGIAPGSIVFSPDSRRLSYVVRTERRWSVVIDGEAGKPYKEIGGFRVRFGPDSKRTAYVAVEKKGQHVVIDGEEGKKYDGIRADTPVFTPDGRHVVYVAHAGKRSYLVVDRNEGDGYDSIVSRGAGIRFEDPKTLVYPVMVGSNIFRVRETLEETPDAPGVREPVGTGKKRRLVLVPIGDVNRPVLAGLQKELRSRLGIEVALGDRPVNPGSMDRPLALRYLKEVAAGILGKLSRVERERLLDESALEPEDLQTEEGILAILESYLTTQGRGVEMVQIKEDHKALQGRGQYDAARIIARIQSTYARDAAPDNIGFLGVTHEDIYRGRENFMYGAAMLEYGLVSYHRFTAKFTLRPTPMNTVVTRLTKQALSTVFFMLGVPRCATPACVRAYARNIAEHDKKGSEPCHWCSGQLEKQLGKK
jgi:predicted Zn-dependent protease/Tol biopolymer transport system component